MTAFDARIKFPHLQCFLTVARLRSANKASTELHVSQPAVSKTLCELEEIIDVAMFDRSSRQMQLTPFGELFMRYASVMVLAQGIDSIAQTTQPECHDVCPRRAADDFIHAVAAGDRGLPARGDRSGDQGRYRI